jgi:Ni/Co efflux regulator RcnB
MKLKMTFALLGTLLIGDGAFAADPAIQEPAREQYQNQVLKKQPQPQDPVAKDPMHIGDLKEGTPAPDKYWRKDYAITDLKAHGLSQPGPEEQWVKIGTDYVLLKTSSGTIQKIIKAK